jgi:hypothetical protein
VIEVAAVPSDKQLPRNAFPDRCDKRGGMSKLRRPAFFGPCVFCFVLGAVYLLGSSSNSALADKSSKEGCRL